jgi:uncharacterized membrane protein
MTHRHPVNQVMHDNASRTQRAVDRFVTFFGSLKFIAWMTAMIVVWIGFNTLTLTGTLHFDKYPYILLNLLFSTQASYAAPLILLSQNRSTERDRLKAEHDYDVNTTALAEIRSDKELTKEVHGLTAEVHRLLVQSMTSAERPQP